MIRILIGVVLMNAALYGADFIRQQLFAVEVSSGWTGLMLVASWVTGFVVLYLGVATVHQKYRDTRKVVWV